MSALRSDKCQHAIEIEIATCLSQISNGIPHNTGNGRVCVERKRLILRSTHQVRSVIDDQCTPPTIASGVIFCVSIIMIESTEATANTCRKREYANMVLL